MSLAFKLWVPPTVFMNLQPPAPLRTILEIPVSLFVTNPGSQPEYLTPADPRGGSVWQVIDADSGLELGRDQSPAVRAEAQASCPPPEDSPPVRELQITIPPRQTRRFDDRIRIDGRFLRTIPRAQVLYNFCGTQSTDAFELRAVL